MKKMCLLAAIMFTVSSVQATLVTSFVNADFESGIVTTGNGAFAGFDAPAAPEIIGWTNYGTVTDGGVEAAGAWWIQGYAYGNCAFVNSGGGAYNMSSYIIQEGDEFNASFIGDGWGESSITATLFYDDPANVIGSFTSTMGAWSFGLHTNETPIVATAGSVGHTLGILIMNDGSNNVGFDEVTVEVIPEPATIGLVGLVGGCMLVVRRRFMI